MYTMTIASSPADELLPQPCFKIGSELYHETYKEYVDQQIFMREDARMFGIYTKAHIPFHQLHAINLMARFAFGTSRYTGATQDDSYGSLIHSSQDRYTWEVRGIYDFTLPFSQEWSPLLGIGYRKLTDRLDQIEEGGYKRTSQYVYATMGIKGEMRLGSWQLEPQLLYHHLLRGVQQSKQDGWILKHHQRTGHGVELAAELSHTLVNQQSISITPYYRYWHIADSDTSYEYDMKTMEPNNKTREVGLRMTYQF